MFLSNIFEKGLEKVVPYVVGFIYIIGALIVVVGLVLGLAAMFMKKNENIILGKAVLLGLDIILGGEILNTLLVRSWNDVKIVGGLVIMRTIMAVVTRWKLKVDQQEERESLSIIESVKRRFKKKNEPSEK